MIRALSNVNTYCRTAFSFSGEKDIHIMRLHCPVHPLRVCAQSRNSGNARFYGRKCGLTGIISKLSGILFYVLEENNTALNVV